MDSRAAARALAFGRIGIGASLVVAPRLAGLVIGGRGATTDGAAVMARAAGIRDIALGAGLLAALDRGRARPWLRWGALCDLTDAVAAARAGDNVPWPTRRLVPLAALGAAVAGSQLGEQLD